MEHVMKKIIIIVTPLMLFLFLISSAFAGNDISPAAKDKCAVCGMFVAKYPDWSAMIEYRNGRRVWFDGVKDLLKGYSNPAKYGLLKDRSEIKAIWVKDYYSLSLIDGRSALYVIGSDTLGPMGKELIPFAKDKDAKGFQKDHLGEKIFRFDQLNAETLKKLE
jgi:nitrous oxide reductase accessory protein NosL